jgi:hypothetical protein
MVLVIYFNMALDTKMLVSYVPSFLERSVHVLVAKHDPIVTTRSKYAVMMVNCNGDKCKLKPWNQSLIGIHLLGLHGSTMFEYKQTCPHVFLQFLGTFILNWQIIFYHIHAQHIHSTWHSKGPHWMSASFFVYARTSSMLLHFTFVNKVTANKEI